MLDKIKELGIPTDSDVAAARFINSDDVGREYHMPALGRKSVDDYHEMIQDIVGSVAKNLTFGGSKHARVMLAYVVCEIINNPEAKAVDIVPTAVEKTDQFFKKHPWTSRDVYERTSDANDASPKAKSTKEEIFKEFSKHDFEQLTRDEIIDLVIDNVNAARSSLVNYYYSYRKSLKT